jgi:hypothetical protein
MPCPGDEQLLADNYAVNITTPAKGNKKGVQIAITEARRGGICKGLLLDIGAIYTGKNAKEGVSEHRPNRNNQP